MKSKMDKFQELYKKLNPGQKKAVDAVEGPVMVIAGPGTGKTQILTLRIANILRQTDAEPESILALTFTESGVVSMRQRLVEIIGSPAYSVNIKTFHGFCNDVIKNYPEEFPRIIGATSITEVDQINILQAVISNLLLKELRPFGDPLFYVKPALSAINELKREGVTPELFRKIAEKELKTFGRIKDLYHKKGPYKGEIKGVYQLKLKQIKKNQELASVYEKYQHHLAGEKLYDYNDMIMEVLAALSRSKELLLILQEQYQYLLVDEHQDTNNSQNKILELLASFHQNPNIFLVGDEKQAIFRFQGASLENFYYFQKLYPEALLVTLKENYRSTQAILDSADSLIAGLEKLKANVGAKPEKIKFYAFSRPEVESYFLVEDIKEKLKDGVLPEEITVLYRDNKDVFLIAPTLEKAGIPFSIDSDQDILADPDIKKLLLLLRTVNEFGAQERFLESMHIDFLGIDPLDIYKIADYATTGKTSVFSIIRSQEVMASLGLVSQKEIADFCKKIFRWVIVSKNQNLPDFFEDLVRESGYLSYILRQRDALERMNKLSSLFDEIKMLIEKHKDYQLKDFLGYLDTLTSQNILIKKKSLARLANRVRLMTAHKAKGQEFGFVYIIESRDSHWGNRRLSGPIKLPPAVFSLSGRKISEGNTNDDERRLFYVALTRAKKGVIISYAKENEEGRDQLPTQFVREIKPELIEQMDVAPYEKNFSIHKEILFAPPIIAAADLKDREFVKKLFWRHGFPVTALNNYLECPWKYFYLNLIRLPRAKTKHQMYGTAVHEALNDFFKAFRQRTPDKDFLLNKFFHYLNLQPLPQMDFKESRNKGEKALSGYYDAYAGKWRTNVLTEFTLKGIVLTPEIRLTGKIDKIEFLGSASEVNVVDYKTSQPKSRAQIEGSAKNSAGNDKRQLVFYNLLLDKYSNRRYKMVSGEIDFIEPDKRGRYKKENFIITPPEVEELEVLVRQTAEEILNLAFWDKRCDNKDCEFCGLREMTKG